MAKFKIALAAFTTLLLFAVVAPFGVNAQAQAARSIDASVTEAADAVVEATVVTERAFEIGGMPYRVYELAVTDTIKGSVADTVYIAALGGMFADGRELAVSHTAHIEENDVLQAALESADPLVSSSVAAAMGAANNAVFQVVGGEDGVVTLQGSLGLAQFAGANDYLLHGSSWESFSPAVPFHINPTGSNMSKSETISTTRAAVSDWIDDPGSLIDFSYEGTTTATGPNLSDGINSVSFKKITSAGFLAQAHWISARNGAILEFDIIVNTRYRFENGSGSGTWFDLGTTLRHEFGHVLGLSHVAARSEVMKSTVTSNTVDQLGDGDLGAARFMYPDSGVGTCNGEFVTVILDAGDSPTEGDDVILGTDGPDIINGLGGNDIICGLDGSDTISGGPGDDTILGGNGADTLNGDDGRDRLLGHNGNDTISGGDLGDRIYGGGGDDDLSGDGGWDWIYGDAGSDVLRGGFGSDKMFGGVGNDRIFGNNGPDKIEGNDGADEIHAGKGRDQVIGGVGNDMINGGTGPDTLYGGDGQDTLKGDKGSDLLFGEGSNDELFGGTGWDALDGGPATDFCSGGFGQDTARTCETALSAP